jgi:class 3 adenylate cyclase
MIGLSAQREGGRRSAFVRHIRRHFRFLLGLVIAAIVTAIAYRYLLDPIEQRTLPYYTRSSLHAIGLGFSGWAVTMAFVALPRSRFGRVLRGLPLIVEFALKALAMTAVLTIVAVGMEFALYPRAQPHEWYTQHLPLIVGLGLVISLVFGAIFEFRRLVGGRILGSFLLGTYHRPRREQRIVMFLDIADSTALAERLGEVRVHDLITRFFFDIDGPIAEHDGEVHAYVGDQVIVSWPLGIDLERNAGWVRAFFAAEARIAALAPAYSSEFGIVPRFRAGVHAGSVVVSECGDSKRQIAFFGDTMNVAARLCDHCKASGDALVASAELLRNTAVTPGFTLGNGSSILLRGRQTPVDVRAVYRQDASPAIAAKGAAA